MPDMDEKRDQKLDLRLSIREKEALILAAAKAERDLSDYARRKLLRGIKLRNGLGVPDEPEELR